MNTIEEAKSGRAKCRTCKKTISKDELRFGLEVENEFSDEPATHWYHIHCAAAKLPIELKEVLNRYKGKIDNLTELNETMDAALKSGKVKPTKFPHIDKAPIGRASCIQCNQIIEKSTFRVGSYRDPKEGVINVNIPCGNSRVQHKRNKYSSMSYHKY
ncbi:PARP-type zinc finger-containing protein [uncultured Winogradskyella sp.]|uniref:PARP-type zinc finger-containing protein n=1 Tax=uncultured Winogradskyella sp. TaxID=395353 RepID=UPI002621CF33|nr:PARP-type zinc finger-containing protein [uncultured Winogradskyella sp.]